MSVSDICYLQILLKLHEHLFPLEQRFFINMNMNTSELK